jgi:hypothetical protein
MKTNRIKTDLIIILLTSFVVIVCWIGFNIYNKSVSSTIDDTLAKEILPIPPHFDTDTIDALNQREKIEPQFSLTQTEEASGSSSTNLVSPLDPTISPEIESPVPLEDNTSLFDTESEPDASGEADLTP